jgi:hypothetical protein
MKKKLIGLILGVILLITILPVEGFQQSYNVQIMTRDIYVGSDNGKLYAFGYLNQPPDAPVISGPSVGGLDIMLAFSALSSDPEEEEIYYKWDWGNGNTTDWLGPYESGEMITTNNSWNETGIYNIRIKARDSSGNESNWSESHSISIDIQIEFSRLQLGYIYLRTFFTNNSYAYVYLLETLGLVVVLSDNGLLVEATATDAVDTVKFELIDIIWEDKLIIEDENGTDGFSAKFEGIATGIFQITIYAYDENETLIDMDSREYLIYLDLTSDSGGGLQQIRTINKIGQKIRERCQIKIRDKYR